MQLRDKYYKLNNESVHKNEICGNVRSKIGMSHTSTIADARCVLRTTVHWLMMYFIIIRIGT